MKVQWWYNASFEDLMAGLETWTTENADISIEHMDWKYVTEPNADSAGHRSGYWYMIVLYK